MDCTVRYEATGNALTDAHLLSFPSVSELYDGQDPRLLETYQRRADDIAPRFSQEHRDKLADELVAYLEEIGADETAFAQANRMRQKDSVAVVTGQQAGLFTGPLYTLYKALSVVGVAQRLERELNRPVVPVFWVASEDHDWAEVNHAYVIDEKDEVRKLQFKQPVPLHRMVYHEPLSDASVQAVLEGLETVFPESEHVRDLCTWMKNSTTPGMSLALWFTRILAYLTRETGLVLLDPCRPALRQLVQSVWVGALEHRHDIAKSVEQAYAEVTAAGFKAEVIRDPSHANLFFVEHGKRYVLEMVDETGLRARSHGVSRDALDWVTLANTNPEAFSANVLMRPVVQDHLLPTLAYVGGPSEVAYHPLSRGVFHAFGRKLPPLLLRQRMTLYPPSVQRHMKKWQIGLDDVVKPRDFVGPLLHEYGLDELQAAMAEMAKASEARWQAWAEQFAELGPQVQDMAMHQGRREKVWVERMETKARRLFKQRHDAEFRQLRQIERWLWTDGHAQERRLNVLALWARYGIDWVRELPRWDGYDQPGPVYHVNL